MTKYRKKPVVIEAAQWFKAGDHPAVTQWGDSDFICTGCNRVMRDHGRASTLEGFHIVCPGDWIITGVKGEHYPCKPDIFDASYERAES